VQRLVQLQHWPARWRCAESSDLHVLKRRTRRSRSSDYARANRVDHIVIGSRASSALRRYLGSVSTRVVAERRAVSPW